MDLSSLHFPVELPAGVASLAAPVEPGAIGQLTGWLADGRHAGMDYMERYASLRADPRTLLPGARSLICVAFPYFTAEKVNLPVSLYARGRDYHEVVRELLAEVAAQLPGPSRVCVDSAPLRERYWAVRAGLGCIGRNNQLIIPGLGSYFFLGFILTPEEITPTPPRNPRDICGDCRRCVDACPGGCISPDGRAIDARRCLSYLTIEHRGDLPEELTLHSLLGCDVCQQVCPHNRAPIPTPIAGFHPSAEFAAMTADDLRAMTPSAFRARFRHSPLLRARLAGMLRNLSRLSPRR